jgi:hypothetical protein
MKSGAVTDLWRVLTLMIGFILAIYVGVLLHECGHALGALLHGDRVYAIVMQIPAPAGYPQVSQSSWMLAWGGIFFGSLFSAVPLLAARFLPAKSTGRFACLLLGAVCLAHNGLYLSVGSITPFSDVKNMIGYGAPRPLLFVLGIPLLAGFVAALIRAVAMVGSRPGDSMWKWIAIVEVAMMPIPAVAVIATLVAPGQQHGATTLAMALLAAIHAAGFAIAAIRTHGTADRQDKNPEASHLQQRWTVTLALFACTALVIAIESLVCRPL